MPYEVAGVCGETCGGSLWLASVFFTKLVKGEAAMGWGFTEDEVILPTSKICLFRTE